MRQLAFPFDQGDMLLGFMQGPYNNAAVELLTAWSNGIEGASETPAPMALCGLGRCGKTAVAQHLVDKMGGIILQPSDQGEYGMEIEGPLIVLDSAERAAGLSLFAAYNRALTAGGALLIVGRGRATEWGAFGQSPPPDLINRLSFLAKVEIDAPTAPDVAEAVQQLLDQAGVRVRERDLHSVIEARLRRDFEAAQAYAVAIYRRACRDGETGRGLLEAAVEDIPDFIL